MKKIFRSVTELWFKSIRILKSYGLKYLFQRACKYIRKQGWRSFLAVDDLNTQYQKWLTKKAVNHQPIKHSCKAVTAGISILMPVYNPDIRYLEEAVESVLTQDSPNWELCLVDDASTITQVTDCLAKFAEKDKRISLIRHDINQGISEVSNSALKAAKSEYVLFMGQEDILRSHAISTFQKILKDDTSLDLIYADEDKLDDLTGRRIDPCFKPEWSPFLLYSFNYIGHPVLVRKRITESIGGLRKEFDGAHEHDFLLRISNLPIAVRRIPDVLYSWRISAGSTSDRLTAKQDIKQEAETAGCRAVREALLRRGYESEVKLKGDTGTYIFRIQIKSRDKVSIVIPTKDNGEILKRCVDSIITKSSYANYEIIIIDNGSSEKLTVDYMNELRKSNCITVLEYPHEFNYPLVNNMGAAAASGSYLIFLNDDTEVISNDWIEALLENCQMPEVGAVGAYLLFPNHLIQHAGIVVGMRGSASHSFYKSDPNQQLYLNLTDCVREVSAVTAACLMIRTDYFNKAGGFDPAFRLGLNDVDLCLRLIKMGLTNIYTPHARLIHHESFTRGEYVNEEEIKLFREIHHDFISSGDPYYHPELSLERNDYSLAV